MQPEGSQRLRAQIRNGQPHACQRINEGKAGNALGFQMQQQMAPMSVPRQTMQGSRGS
jgi:hypothetical protein